MIRSRKLLLSTVLTGAIAAFAFSPSSQAADLDITGTLVASVAISLTPVADMDFATVDFVTGAHSGDLILAPNSTLATGNTPTGLTVGGTPVGGQFQIDLTGAGNVEVSCDQTGVMGDGTRDLTISEVKFDIAATTYAAAANTCAGLNTTPATVDTTAGNPNIFIGATLQLGANGLDGSVGGTPYDTATGGGDPITFRVVFP